MSDDSYARRSGRGIWVAIGACLLILACVGAGFFGGWLHDRGGINSIDHAPVVIQEVTPAKDNQEPSMLNMTAIEQVAATQMMSVVEVTTEYKETNAFIGSFILSGAGSGVILSEEGHIVTNNHVVEGASSIKVRLHNGEEYDAALIGMDSQTDLAVIAIDAKGLVPVVLGDSSGIRVGELVIAIGNPLGELGGSVSQGIISATARDIPLDDQTMTLIQTTAAINPGNSGGALFDADGKLIGVVNAKLSGTKIEGLGFAIPVNTVRDIAPRLIEDGRITGRPSLGAELVDIGTLESAYFQLKEPGVYVLSVYGDTGLKAEDEIVKVDGQDTNSAAEVKTIIQQHQAGDTLSITVMRNGREKTLSVTLAEDTGK